MVAAKDWIHASIAVLPQHTVTPGMGTKVRSYGFGLQNYSHAATYSPARFGSISTARGAIQKTPDAPMCYICKVWGLCRLLPIHPHISAGQENKSLPRQKSNLQAEQFEGFNLFAVVSCCAICASLGFVTSEGHWNARQRCSSYRCTFAQGSFDQSFSPQGLLYSS